MEGDAKRVAIPLKTFEFDYNVQTSLCAWPECLVTCVYYNNGQENPGEYMQCKIGGRAYFCTTHRPHDAHPEIKCNRGSEDEEEEEEEEENGV